MVCVTCFPGPLKVGKMLKGQGRCVESGQRERRGTMSTSETNVAATGQPVRLTEYAACAG